MWEEARVPRENPGKKYKLHTEQPQVGFESCGNYHTLYQPKSKWLSKKDLQLLFRNPEKLRETFDFCLGYTPGNYSKL